MDIPYYPLKIDANNLRAFAAALNEDLRVISNLQVDPGPRTFITLEDVDVTAYDVLEDYAIPTYNQGTGFWETGLKGTVLTTDDTPTTIATITLGGYSFENVQIVAYVVARRVGGSSLVGAEGDMASFIKVGSFRFRAAVTSQVGTTTPLVVDRDDPAWDIDWDLVTHAPSVDIVATGAIDTDIDWRHRIMLVRVH